jgi:hypothetical protein
MQMAMHHLSILMQAAPGTYRVVVEGIDCDGNLGGRFSGIRWSDSHACFTML